MQNSTVNVVSLFHSERKTTVIHNRVTTDLDIEENQQFIVMSGWRNLLTTPVFSQIYNGTDRTKYLRKIPAETKGVCCTFMGPITIGAGVPIIGMIPDSKQIAFVGSFLEANPRKLIIRRIQLTGYPTKIGARLIKITMMFNNPEDVDYFSPVELSTRSNLRGRILGPVGTHGDFKARFSGRMTHQDICVLPLYKRIFPELTTMKIHGAVLEPEIIE